nr:MAG: putative capsid protein [Arizlama virus]
MSYNPNYKKKRSWDNGTKLYAADDEGIVSAQYGRQKIIRTGRVIQQNPGAYAATLIDPFNFKGIRIPDLACYPTCTFSLETSLTWVPVTAGDDTNTTALVVDLNRDPQYQAMQGSSGGHAGNRVGAAVPIATNLSALYKSSRLVSAGVVVKFAGNDSNCKGAISIVNYPGFDAIGVTLNKTTTYANEVNYPERSVNFYYGPVREGAAAYYRPVDTSCFEIGPIAQVDCFGVFIISLRGIDTTSPPTFTVDIQTNWEGIPNGAMIGSDMLSSTMDIGAFQRGLEAGASTMDVCDANAGTQAQVTHLAQTFISPPQVKKQKQGPAGGSKRKSPDGGFI